MISNLLSWGRNVVAEYKVQVFLVIWFSLNMGISLYNKAIYQQIDFPYPFTTSLIHITFTYVGVLMLSYMGFTETDLTPSRDVLSGIAKFSIIFTANIFLASFSVKEVSVPLNQILRATVPLFTLFINTAYYNQVLNWRVVPPVILVVLGCFCTAKGDLSVTVYGISLLLISCAVSSLKGIISQRAQINGDLSTMGLLKWICPMAMVQLLLLSIFSNEISTIYGRGSLYYLDSVRVMHISIVGVLAFLMNYFSFRTVVLSSPLTMNVLANVKQMLASFIAIPLFGGTFSSELFIGVFLACGGSLWYSQASRKETTKNVFQESEETQNYPSVHEIELNEGREEKNVHKIEIES